MLKERINGVIVATFLFRSPRVVVSRNFSPCRKSSSVVEVLLQQKVSHQRQGRGNSFFVRLISTSRRRWIILLQREQRIDGDGVTASWWFSLSVSKLRVCLWLVSCSKTRSLSRSSSYILRRCSSKICLRWIPEWVLHSSPSSLSC